MPARAYLPHSDRRIPGRLLAGALLQHASAATSAPATRQVSQGGRVSKRPPRYLPLSTPHQPWMGPNSQLTYPQPTPPVNSLYDKARERGKQADLANNEQGLEPSGFYSIKNKNNNNTPQYAFHSTNEYK